MMENTISRVELNRRYYSFDDLKVTEKTWVFERHIYKAIIIMKKTESSINKNKLTRSSYVNLNQ